LIKALGLNLSADQEIKMNKLWREVREAKTEEEKTTLMKKLKELHPAVRFDFPRPVELTNTTDDKKDP
jgi:hypothetical protein